MWALCTARSSVREKSSPPASDPVPSAFLFLPSSSLSFSGTEPHLHSSSGSSNPMILKSVSVRLESSFSLRRAFSAAAAAWDAGVLEAEEAALAARPPGAARGPRGASAVERLA